MAASAILHSVGNRIAQPLQLDAASMEINIVSLQFLGTRQRKFSGCRICIYCSLPSNTSSRFWTIILLEKAIASPDLEEQRGHTSMPRTTGGEVVVLKVLVLY
jgi:hypothetical protein